VRRFIRGKRFFDLHVKFERTLTAIHNYENRYMIAERVLTLGEHTRLKIILNMAKLAVGKNQMMKKQFN
jgi:DNA-binding ferritin-like protein